MFNEEPGQLEPLANAINAFKKQIINSILKEHEVTEIIRIGYVRRFVIRDPSLAATFLNSFNGFRLNDIDDIDLKFTKTRPYSLSMALKEINDKENVIYNFIKRAGIDELYVAIDFQRIFEPALIKIYDKFNFENFLSEAENHSSNFLNKNLKQLVGMAA
ncbi:MAG: hypothetical protein FJY65_06800 [Calditrichaeota bacterium]|nr:hypothetical protein [Calditrichota bacterium]